MNIIHKLEIRNNKLQDVLYVYYPAKYEFALDFNTTKKNVKEVSQKIREYVTKNKSKFKKGSILIVLNGVMIGSVLLSQLVTPQTNIEPINNQIISEIKIQNSKNENAVKAYLKEEKNQNSNKVQNQKNTESIQKNTNVKKENVKNNSKEKNENSKTEEKTTTSPNIEHITQEVTSPSDSQTIIDETNLPSKDEHINEETNMPSIENDNVTSNNEHTDEESSNLPNSEEINQKDSNEENPSKDTVKIKEEITTPSLNNPPETVDASQLTNIQVDIMVPVQLKTGEIVRIKLNDYLIGVIGAEMPAEFNIEALKAQAVAARTYALKRVAAGTILTTDSNTQNYMNESQLKEMWGNSFDKYYNKIKDAVYSTSNETITYNGTFIDALYFSTSNGRTEDAENVWGYSVPYLKSVDSNFEIGSRYYYSQKIFSREEFCKKLEIEDSSSISIEILEKTIGERVDKISINNKIYSGIQIRSILGLNSADFDIEVVEDSVIIDVRGNGHGVGMSQRGANILADKGLSYKEILKYYYTDVEISKNL